MRAHPVARASSWCLDRITREPVIKDRAGDRRGHGRTPATVLDDQRHGDLRVVCRRVCHEQGMVTQPLAEDRKSTRLNSSHVAISYAVFCLKKKNQLLTQEECGVI